MPPAPPTGRQGTSALQLPFFHQWTKHSIFKRSLKRNDSARPTGSYLISLPNSLPRRLSLCRIAPRIADAEHRTAIGVAIHGMRLTAGFPVDPRPAQRKRYDKMRCSEHHLFNRYAAKASRSVISYQFGSSRFSPESGDGPAKGGFPEPSRQDGSLVGGRGAIWQFASCTNITTVSKN